MKCWDIWWKVALYGVSEWVLTKFQPIFAGDMITYLSESIFLDETAGKTYDIGGPYVLTYVDMMKVYGRLLNKTIRIVIIPFLTPRLSSYWIDLVTPIKASLARPLVDSLKHEAVVKDDSIKRLIQLKPKSFWKSLQHCMEEEHKYKKKKIKRLEKKERTSLSANYKILLITLYFLLAIGTTYYFLDAWNQFLKPFWLSVAAIWYLLILAAIYFVRYDARLGALIAGILGRGSLAFWLLDNSYLVSGFPIVAERPGNDEVWRDITGITIDSFTILPSHNIFHKIQLHRL